MKHLLIYLLLFMAAGTAVAQTRGSILYNMDVSSDDPEMAMAAPMMKGSTMELSFVPGKSKVNMLMGTFMKMQTITDESQDKGIMLMEMMGSKTAIELKPSEEVDEEAKQFKSEVTTETKDILGFKCTKAIIKDSSGVELVMWIATDLKASLKGQQQFIAAGINGVPLEFSTVANKMNIHFTATKFEKTVDESIFSVAVPEGYTIITEDELEQM